MTSKELEAFDALVRAADVVVRTQDSYNFIRELRGKSCQGAIESMRDALAKAEALDVKRGADNG